MPKFDESFQFPEIHIFDQSSPAQLLNVEDGPFGEDLIAARKENDSDQVREVDWRVRQRVGAIALPGWERFIVARGAQRLFEQHDRRLLFQEVPEVRDSYDALAEVDLEKMPAPYLGDHLHVLNWLMITDPHTRGLFTEWNASRYDQLRSRLQADSDLLREDSLGLIRRLIDIGLLTGAQYDSTGQLWETESSLQPIDTLGMAALTAHGLASIREQPVRRLGNIYQDPTTMEGIGDRMRRTSFQTSLYALGVIAHRGFLKGMTDDESPASLLLENAAVSYLTDLAFEAEWSVTPPNLSLEPRPGQLRFSNERAFLAGIGVSSELLVAAGTSPLGSGVRRDLMQRINEGLRPHGREFETFNYLYSREATPFMRHQVAAECMGSIGLHKVAQDGEGDSLKDINEQWIDWLVNFR